MGGVMKEKALLAGKIILVCAFCLAVGVVVINLFR